MKSALEKYIAGLTISQGRHAGQRFKLLPWQRRFLRGAFAQPDDAALSLARGGGKSTFVAAIACAAVDVHGPLVEPHAETLIVASSFEQGLIVFRHILAFLQPSFAKYGDGGKAGRFRIQDSVNRAAITDRKSGAMIRVLGSDPRRLHGAAPRLLLLDEIAQWPRERIKPMLAALKTSRGKIADSRALWIGTRPESPEHPFQRALDGVGTGFALSYAARQDDPPFRRTTWKRANPGLDHLPDLEAVIRSEAKDARRDAEALQSFKALRLNMGTSDITRSVLLDAATFQRNEVADPLPAIGPFALGLDLGQNQAMSAAAAYWPETGRLECVAVFPELPSLRERGLRDGVGGDYQAMQRRGELIIAGRRISDIGALLRECLERWGKPQAIATDRWREAELRDQLEATGFPLTNLILRGQGFRDGGEDCREFRRAFVAGEVHPTKSLLLRAAMSEARTVGDPAGNHKLSKKTEGGRRAEARDDAAAAAILAVSVGSRGHTKSIDGPPRRLRVELV